MICNIIDNRTVPYRWKSVNAIVEPTWNDNTCESADQAEPSDDESVYEERNGISDAVSWASGLTFPATLYLYDEGTGTAGMSEVSADGPG